VFVVNSVFLWGGTNAFNTAHDRDHGAVTFLPRPPPLPRGLGLFGVVTMLLAVVASALWGWRTTALSCLAVLLSVYYSAGGPGLRRGKEIGGVDNLINAFGCGLWSVLFGYCTTAAALDTRVLVVGFAYTAALFGGLPACQVFQLRPGETYAEARNYTALLGPTLTLRTGAGLFVLHAAVLVGLEFGHLDTLFANPLRAISWLGWLGLVGCGAFHSWRWSHAPFRAPYRRMVRQATIMSASQILWTCATWLG
jgi:hypothetical protein